MCVYVMNENYCYVVITFIILQFLFITINNTFIFIYHYCCYRICKAFYD